MQTIKIDALASNDTNHETMRIVMADDDRNEHLLMALAAGDAKRTIQIDFVDDGAQLLDELAHTKPHALPNAIILDLRMPRMDGTAALKELQHTAALRHIPVVVFTTSARIEDERSCYELGAFHFETKPGTFSGLVQFFDRISEIATTAFPAAA
jgi:two-component system response regulator